MGKGDINAKVGVHRDEAQSTTVWELSLLTHEEFTRAQVQDLVTEAATSLYAFRAELGSLKPNWDLSDAQTAALWLAVKEQGEL